MLLQLPGVADGAAAARAAVDRLLRHRAVRSSSALVSAESALRGAHASALLDGATVDLEQLRGGEPVTEPVAAGALRVAGDLGQVAAVWRRAPVQALARLHVLAATGLQPAAELGRPDPRRDVTARLAALARTMTGDASDVPVVLLAAVAHGELLAMAPFPRGNGVVARAAGRLAAIVGGLDPKGLAVPEVGHRAHEAEYRSAAAGYARGDAEGIAAWLRHCCVAMELGAQEGLAICEAVARG